MHLKEIEEDERLDSEGVGAQILSFGLILLASGVREYGSKKGFLE